MRLILLLTLSLTFTAAFAQNSDSVKHDIGLKIHFISPILENTSFSLEKSVSEFRSWEIEFGIIGVGYNSNIEVDNKGGLLSFGYKFIHHRHNNSNRGKFPSFLDGHYVKPQVLASAYKFHRYLGTGSEIKKDIAAFAFLINIGNQSVYDNFFIIDYSFGLGYGYSSTHSNDRNIVYERVNHYSFLLGDKNSPIALSLKIKIGIIIN